MKKVFLVLIAALCAATAFGWTETFLDNPSGLVVEPWEDVADLYAYESIGFDGSAGIQGPAVNWVYGHAYRQIPSGSSTISARVKAKVAGETNWQEAIIAVMGNKGWDATAQYPAGYDLVKLQFEGGYIDDIPTLSLISEDYDGAGVYQTDNRKIVNAAGFSVGWVDGFEDSTYPHAPISWDSLTTPWEGSSNQGAWNGTGYNGTSATYGPGAGWERGHAWRPTTGGDTLVGQMYLDPANTYQVAILALTPDKSCDPGNGEVIGDIVELKLLGDGTGTAATLETEVMDFDGSTYVTDTRFTVTGLSAGTWYDVKATVSGLNVTFYYKASSASTWNTVGTLAAYSDFTPNYVAVSCMRSGFIDNAGYIINGEEPWLTKDTWYDVKMVLTDVNATGYVKKSSDTEWVTIGTVTLYAGFDANYVAVANCRGGYTDDITVTKKTCDTYLAGDLNQDCEVNFGDLAVMVGNWLTWAYDINEVGSRLPLSMKNPVVFAPQINAITVDGVMSDWTKSSQWLEFGRWWQSGLEQNDPVIAGLTSLTKAKYAWNDAADRLYIGIESTELGEYEVNDVLIEIGGLMGNLTDTNATPLGGAEFTTPATQIKLYNLGSTVAIENQLGGTTSGISAAAKVSGGKLIVEISTPIYSDWYYETPLALSSQQDVYVYVNIYKAHTMAMPPNTPEGDVAADSQVANGYYVKLFSTPTMKWGGTLVRLISDNKPQTVSDLSSGRTKIASYDYNEDLNINLSDFAVMANDWLKQ